MRNPFPVSAESQLRAAALSFRSLLEANDAVTLTMTCKDGYELSYRLGDGLVMRARAGTSIAFYPEAELDDERWAPATWTPEANSAS